MKKLRNALDHARGVDPSGKQSTARKTPPIRLNKICTQHEEKQDSLLVLELLHDVQEVVIHIGLVTELILYDVQVTQCVRDVQRPVQTTADTRADTIAVVEIGQRQPRTSV